VKSKRRGLTGLQRRFLDRLFSGDGDEAAALRELGIPTWRYRRWLANAAFLEEMAFRIGAARRQWQLLVARYAPAAAARLIALTTDEKPETARKACLDVLALQQRLEVGSTAGQTERGSRPRGACGAAKRKPVGGDELDPGVADRMLAFLAREDAEPSHAGGDVPDESQVVDDGGRTTSWGRSRPGNRRSESGQEGRTGSRRGT